MNKKKIIEILKRSAESESREIIEEARRKARELEENAEREMDAERERRINKLLNEMAVERARRMGEADHRYEEMVLKAEHLIVSKIVAEAQKTLSRIRDDAALYAKVMKKLLKEASAGFSGGEVQIRVNPKDEELVRRILSELGKDYTVHADQSVEFGLIVEDPDRGYTVYNTFDFRLKKAKMVLLEKLTDILETKSTG